MGELVKQKIQLIRRRALWMVWGWAVCLLFATAVTVLIMFGLIDYLFRGQDIGMRYLVSFGAVLLIGTCTWQLMKAVFAARFSELDVAQFVENRVSGMGDRLSSTLAFIDQSGKTSTTAASGSDSVQMQQAVIQDAEQRIADVQAADVLDFGPIRSALIYAMLALAAIIAIDYFNRSAIQTGLKRVLAPWSNVNWPLRNQLHFRNQVERLTHGSQFIAVVVDKNKRLPRNIRFEFRIDGQPEKHFRDMTELDDRMIVRLENVTESFRYRAVGGDDVTAWYHIEVLPAPQLEMLEFEVIPPTYSRLPVQKFHDDIKAVVGSRLSVVARASEELDDATIHWQAKQTLRRFSPDVSADGKTVRFPRKGEEWLIEESAVLQLEITNKQSLSGGLDHSYQIVAVTDLPPIVALNSSGTMGSVTARATIPLQVSVSEDIRLESIRLLYFTNRDATPQPLTLMETIDGERKTLAGNLVGNTDSTSGEKYTAAYPLDLTQLRSLDIGDSVHLYVEAIDAKQQLTTSSKLNFRVATPNELLQSLLELQRMAYEKLISALQNQQKSIKQLETARFAVESGQHLPPSGLNGVYRSRRFETEVVKDLTEPDSGTIALLTKILQQFRSNSIQRKQLVDQIAAVRREVESVVQHPLSRTTFHLAEISRLAKDGLNKDDANEFEKLLQLVSENQHEVVTRLEELTGLFSQIDDLREAIKTWTLLRREQDQLAQVTRALSLETVGKQFDQLTGETQNKVDGLKLSQKEISRVAQLASWELSELQKKSVESSAESRMVQAALEKAGDLQIDSQMRDTTTDIANNKLGSALVKQEKIVDAIDQVLFALQGNRRPAKESVLNETRQTLSHIRKLAGQQAVVTGKLDSAEKSIQAADEATANENVIDAKAIQDEITEGIQELSRQLGEQEDEPGGKAKKIDNATETAEKTARQLSEGEIGPARQSSRENEKILNELADEIQQEIDRQQSRNNKARNDHAMILLAELIQLQQDAIKRLDGFQMLENPDKLRAKAIPLSIARTERELAEAVERLKDQFKEQLAFEFVLGQAATLLSDSATELESGNYERLQATKLVMQDALMALQQVALVLDRQSDQEHDPGSNNKSEDSNQNQPGVQINAAEIALLLESQQGILKETARVEKLRIENSGKLTNDLKSRIARLEKQESNLIEIIRLYSEKLGTGKKPVDNGEQLPDLPIPELPGF